MDELTRRLSETLQEHCRLATSPVAVKLAAPGETPPERLKYPTANLGGPLAVCQGMTMARTLGWTVGFRAEDHGCPLPRVFLGHIAPDTFLTGAIAEFYQEDLACGEAMEASYARWPQGRWAEVWLAPAARAPFTPDLVVAYGSPAQILALIHGANFGHGPGLASQSTGRYGCSLWLAGAIQAGECTYMVPGPGERIFAGAQDHEMSFAIPYPKIERLIEGMTYVRQKGSYRFPPPPLGAMSTPRIPEKYFAIDPGE
ncbi:MAG: DUF169 domain-containing protein [Deltaproteobacteria bacterium]|nr:DUF169 domain-containing protein [Deltaproteobacteria bacterium]